MSAAEEFDEIVQVLRGTSWQASRERISGVECGVLVRRVERLLGASPGVSQGADSVTKSGNGDTEKSPIPALTRENVFRPKSPMGVGTGLAGTASQRPASGGSSPAFGSLATVRAMSTGKTAWVIGFDTEFTYLDAEETERHIDSYQFSTLDPEDTSWRIEIVVLPMAGLDRVAIEDVLAVVVRETGLWRAAGLPDPRGIPRRDFWMPGDYGASIGRLFHKHKVEIVLAGHMLPADLTTFARPVRQRGDGRYDDVLRRVTSASGGLVSLRPIRMVARPGTHGGGERWLPLSITVRDTMGQSAPGQKSLAVLGEACGVPKLSVGDSISDMTGLRDDDLVTFLDYGVNDATIVLEYLAMLWGDNAVPPVTISGGGAHALREGIKRYWGIQAMPNAEFMARFQGLVKVSEGDVSDDDGLSYYSVRSLTPVDGDANQAHSAFKKAFHGGLNTAQRVGWFGGPTFDHDIQSAYPTAMASIVDVDFEHGCIEEVVKDRELAPADFPLGIVTPLVAYASWEFPEGVEPCLPVRVGQSIVYPRTSEGQEPPRARAWTA